MASLGIVSWDGFTFPDGELPCLLASGIKVTDIGKALTQDTTANTFKLAGAGDPVHGRLLTVEDRAQEGVLVGTIQTRFCAKLPVKTGETVIVGDSVQGAGSGEVKALVASVDTDGTGDPVILAAKHSMPNKVMQVLTGYVVVAKGIL